MGQTRLDIEKVADAFYPGADLDGEEADQEQLQLREQVEKQALRNETLEDFSATRLDTAVARIGRHGKLTPAELKKLRLAGEMDIARLMADVNTIRAEVDVRDRQQLIQFFSQMRNFHGKISDMFRSKSRYDQSSDSLFGRTANTLLKGQQIVKDIQLIPDRPEPRVAVQVVAPPKRDFAQIELEINAPQRNRNQFDVEIKETMKLLDRKWMNARMKQRGTLE